MSLFALDTDMITLYRKGHAAVIQRVSACPLTDLAITVISAEEQLSGWYTVLRRSKRRNEMVWAYHELADAIRFLGAWPILHFTEPAMIRYQSLQGMKLGVRAADLRIAAIVLEHQAVLVTRNARDFQRVPNLRIEDWAE
jgi:tRNA(fMet)-specific endonuclease VapC